MKEDQIKGMIESKRLIALELRKKRNLAKLQSEKCTDAMKRLVQGLVVGVRMDYFESCDFNEQKKKPKAQISLNKQISDPCVQNLVSTGGSENIYLVDLWLSAL